MRAPPIHDFSNAVVGLGRLWLEHLPAHVFDRLNFWQRELRIRIRASVARDKLEHYFRDIPMTCLLIQQSFLHTPGIELSTISILRSRTGISHHGWRCYSFVEHSRAVF